MGTGVGNGRESSPSLKPGDEVVGLTAEEAFSMIASARNVRGIDSQWNIVDSDAFGASLEQAGLDPAQVSALRDMDISIDTYVELTRAEVACIRAFGVDVSEVSVSRDSLSGLAFPSYGFQVGGGGYTEEQTNHIQASCQKRFTGVYEMAYNTRLGPSPDRQQELLISRANSYLGCVRGKGEDVPFLEVDTSNIDDFMSWLATHETPGCSFADAQGG